MKKIFSVLILAVMAIAMSSSAQAQLIRFGVKGGLNMSSLDFNKDIDMVNENSTGFFVGPMAEVNIPIVGLGLDGALMYSQRGKDDFKKQGIEIPVNLKYSFGLGSLLGVYVAAGPDFFYNFNDIDIENLDAKRSHVALNLGAGVKLLNHLQIGVTYQIPLGDSFDLKYVLNNNEKKIGETKTWQVSAAYLF